MDLFRRGFACAALLAACTAGAAPSEIPAPPPSPSAAAPPVGDLRPPVGDLRPPVGDLRPDAAASLAAFTPLPLPTTGPTPTPILYVVQPGDTLVGIAFRAGVTVESLQVLNPTADPLALQPGQVLILPSPDATPGAPTPTPVQISASNMTCYETPAESVLCLGEITNLLNEPITGVVVQVTLIGADGQPAAIQHALPALDVLFPGERAPLGAVFLDAPTEAGTVASLVLAAEPAGGLAGRYTRLAVSEVEEAPTESGYRVSGRLTNEAEGQVEALTIVVTTYDEAEHVTGYRTLRLSAALAPGASTPFEVAVLPAGPAVASAVGAQGRLP